MTHQILSFIDIIGTIAFAVSGAFSGIARRMDLFGINIMAIAAACGGGFMRDVIIGRTPPGMFTNPFYIGLAALTANILFALVYMHKHFSERTIETYEHILFWFDTLGLAAFTVDGVLIGIEAGFGENIFLLVFLGFMTGTGGGVLRDILAVHVPDIFRKHIYAVASIAGAWTTSFLLNNNASEYFAAVSSFIVIITLRVMAARFKWNLPGIKQ